MWTTWGTVEEFNYINPHPAMKFARTDKNGNTEHWAGEMANNVGQLARLGWTKSRSVAALKPGTRVKLYLATAVTGGFTAYVQLVESETGEAPRQRERGNHPCRRYGRRSRRLPTQAPGQVMRE